MTMAKEILDHKHHDRVINVTPKFERGWSSEAHNLLDCVNGMKSAP